MRTLVSKLIQNIPAWKDNLAIVDQGEKYTYGDLSLRISLSCQILRDCGVSKGDVVVLAIPNSIDYVAILHALWQIGAIAAPLHSQAKEREILKATEHTNARVVFLSDPRLFKGDAAPEALKQTKRLNVSEFKEQLANSKAHSSLVVELSASTVTEDDFALILFTSGTTGDPKGVTLSHKNLYVNTAAIVDYLSLTQDDSIYSILPFNYSYGNSVLQTHLFCGAAIYLGESMVFPQKVANDLINLPVTGFSGVPSTFAILIDKTNIAEHDVGLRYVTQAGGALDKTTKDKILDAFNNTDLFVMYGQTEAAARIAYLPPEKLSDKLGSAGKALSGIEIAIVDDDNQELPHETLGEIVVKGENVMTGYWNNPEATSETIINGWLHTGDLGYMDDEGYVFIKGRKSHMIKSGAHRIHPAEIEEVIMELDFVAEVAVVGRDDPLMGQKLVACVVAQSPEVQDSRALQKHCREQLPMHKQPKVVEWLDALPRTTSGKIKKHELN